MDIIFREHSEIVYVYTAKESITDPTENIIEYTLNNPLPIKAVVSDIAPEKIQWSMPGVATDRAKSLIIKEKYKGLIKASYKIKYDGEYYEGWRLNGKLQFRKIGKNYLEVKIYAKKV